MKRLTTFFVAAVLALAASAQTLNVVTGNVTTQYAADQAGEMTYSDDGAVLAIAGKTFNTSDISKIYTDNSSVSGNTVAVNYNGSTATVTVSGDCAPYITTTVSGAHVSIVQGDVTDEVTYVLSGSSSDGEFYMEGSYKATLHLNGLTLTNPSGAAINIQDGKRIDVKVEEGTENTLTDCANGDQKACLVIKGHAEFKGKGTLTVYGNTKHGIKTGEYMQVKNCTINVLSAVGDGIHANEYFLMESGTISISGVGDDGLQTELDGTTNTGETTDHEDEDSANIYLEGGTITIGNSAAGGKGINADGGLVISAGTVNVTVTGSNVRSGSDTTAAKGIKADGAITVSGGTITVSAKNHEAIESKSTIDITGGIVSATSSDDAINSASHLTISGGYVMGISTGNDGIDANGNMYIKGGIVYASCSGSPEVALDANTEGGYQLYVSGGTVVAIGGLENGSSLSQSCYQASSWNKGAWYALTSGSDTFAFKTPSSGGNGMVVSASSEPALTSGVSVSGGTAIFDGMGNVGGTISGGSTVSLSSYSGGGMGGGPGGNQPGGGGGPGGGGPGGGWR